MIRAWLVAAALGGFLSVAAGAAAAHLPSGERGAELLRSGALYGMVHAAALIAVTAMAQSRDRLGLALTVAGWSFAAGMLLFSLSLFALALTEREWLSMITPFGGRVCSSAGPRSPFTPRAAIRVCDTRPGGEDSR
jgi:uncharacterized membrane protein YgdD (TMEM256/DUF423 family)